jgi:HK97 family phage major capsid protein
VNPIRQIARIVQTTVDTWRGVTSGAITASYAAEATETTDNSPTLAQPEISTEKAQAFIPFSIEVSMDWPSIRDEIGSLLADAKDVLEASKFTTGTGTNEPFGVITGTTNTVNAAAGADAFTLANLYALRAALPPRYRPRATFMGNLLILDRIRQFETSTGGTASGSVWVDSLQDDLPARLFGRAVYEASEMASAATTGNKFLVYGDFSRYVIVDRIGLQVDFIPHLFGANQRPTGQRGLYAFWRNGAKVVDANAFRALIGTA